MPKIQIPLHTKFPKQRSNISRITRADNDISLSYYSLTNKASDFLKRQEKLNKSLEEIKEKEKMQKENYYSLQELSVLSKNPFTKPLDFSRRFLKRFWNLASWLVFTNTSSISNPKILSI